MKKLFILLHCLFLVPCLLFSQDIKVYPTNWWVGMKWNKVQLMLYGDGVDQMIPQYKMTAAGIKLADGITLKRVHHPENGHYVFLDIEIAPNAKPGMRQFNFNTPGFRTKIDFELKARRAGNGTAFAQGVRSEDFIYLLMPDRFANGDYSNDKVPGMRDQSLNRDSLHLRHGGDLQGVIDHLDYLKDLGVTALWMTPVIENDMPGRTEHGYAFTNHYVIDPRFGGNTTYKKLSDELHKRGMKLVQDAVYNHVGSDHFTVLDPPMKDWVHQWPEFTQTNHKNQAIFDPYGAPSDKTKMLDGWFVRQMPDMNQTNPFVANYLIQHAIWSVEEFGVDGWRIDTYMYCDLDFMNRCNKALVDEYPKMTMFGECWVGATSNQAYFAQNNLDVKFKSNLIGVCDFQWIFSGLYPAVKDGRVDEFYQVFSNDFLYKDPMNNVIFLDNHDITRFYSEVGEDEAKLKMGIGCLLTQRGVPEMYYGTEILMTGSKTGRGGDLNVRKDFPGGWKEDAQNKFVQAGRNEKENEMFNWTRTLANFRKNSSAIKTGKLMQYAPQNGVYTYFRYDKNQTVMVVLNAGDKERTVDPKRFVERTTGFSKAKSVMSSIVSDLNTEWKIPAKTIWVMELGK